MRLVDCCVLMVAMAGLGLSAGAQSSSSGFGVTTMESLNGKTTAVANPRVACPVTLRALQGTGYGLVHVRGEEPANAPGQRVHLIVINGKRGAARSARVLVTGLSAKNRLKNVSNAEEPADANKTVTVTFDPEDATSVAAELVLRGFTSVRSVELQSITYQDGSAWSVAKGEACRVTPDSLMLVAAH